MEQAGYPDFLRKRRQSAEQRRRTIGECIEPYAGVAHHPGAALAALSDLELWREECWPSQVASTRYIRQTWTAHTIGHLCGRASIGPRRMATALSARSAHRRGGICWRG